MIEVSLQDLKSSLRMFRENPGFTLTAVAALAIEVRLNTAIFSVFNAVLLKPVPFPAPERLFLGRSGAGRVASFLYGVKSWDTTVFLAVPALLIMIALVAVLIPAIRATRIDPMTALRYE